VKNLPENSAGDLRRKLAEYLDEKLGLLLPLTAIRAQWEIPE
jgi:hypothetical protein